MPGVVQPLAEVQANILHGEHTPSDGTHKSSGQEIIPQKAKDYSCKFTDGAANCQAMGHDTQKLLSDTVASTIREAGQEIEPAMIGSGSKKPKPQTGPQRQECRAAKLKKLYPDMTGIPDKVSQGFKRKLIANLGVVPPEDREEKKKQRQRALSLKKQYPDMAGIPEFVSPDLKKKLIRGGEIDGDKNKERQRASDLKKRFPQMQGIPDQISKAAKNILVAEYQAKLKAPAGPAKAKKASGKKAKLRARLADLPPRPAAPPSNPKSTYPIRQFARLKRENADSITISGKVAPLSDKRRDQKSAPSAQLPSRPIPRHHNSVYRNTSDKMAPLSNERRAEVAMNLRGHTGLDPIMID